MEYQVPQFIEIEDKIVGPLTLKQFIYLAGGAGICVIFLVYLPLVFGILCSLPVAAFVGALAFYKINGKPFVDVLESAVSYYTGAKLFLWKKVDKAAVSSVVTAAPTPAARQASRLTRSKLSDLAWSLDINKEGGNQS